MNTGSELHSYFFLNRKRGKISEKLNTYPWGTPPETGKAWFHRYSLPLQRKGHLWNYQQRAINLSFLKLSIQFYVLEFYNISLMLCPQVMLRFGWSKIITVLFPEPWYLSNLVQKGYPIMSWLPSLRYYNLMQRTETSWSPLMTYLTKCMWMNRSLHLYFPFTEPGRCGVTAGFRIPQETACRTRHRGVSLCQHTLCTWEHVVCWLICDVQ